MRRVNTLWILLLSAFVGPFAHQEIEVMAQGLPFRQRLRVPPLPDQLEWLNTAGTLSLEKLRGKFVLLDFWTYCCINCMHILPELEKLEKAYPRELVVIGVHTAKFDAERDSARIIEAIRRYGIRHPVINDKDRVLWNLFGVNAWPTLVLIDPEGYVVWGQSGETRFEVLDNLLRTALPYYRQRGLVDETPLVFGIEVRRAERPALYYPGKILADSRSRRLFISDSGHNRIVVSTWEGKLVDIIGNGKRGLKDGTFADAEFNDPQGLALQGEILFVADTKNHAIRKVDIQSRQVTTIAGTGKQLERLGPFRTARPNSFALASPWDLCLVDDDLYIAMAGTHQIWRLSLTENLLELFAGNGREDIVDGPPRPERPFQWGFASFAQPSGLATDGSWLYVADSEGSSIRAVPLKGQGQVRTVVGTAHLPYARLFTFGDVDGAATVARFQHPLGVAYWEGTLFVADTYNNKIRTVDPQTGETKTFVGGPGKGFSDMPPLFFEPGGICAADGKLFVADTNNHAVRVIDIRSRKVDTIRIDGLHPVEPESLVDESEVAGQHEFSQGEAIVRRASSGKLLFEIIPPLPPGWKINWQAPASYKVEEIRDGELSSGILSDTARGREFVLRDLKNRITFEVPVTAESGQTTLRVTVHYFTCTDDQEGICQVRQASWILPLTLQPDGPDSPILLTPEMSDDETVR